MTTVINMRDTRAVVEAQRAGRFVYVGRESCSVGKWGNRYTHLNSRVPGTIRVESREVAVQMFESDLRFDRAKRMLVKAQLKDKTLACWCAPALCHADVLARIANEDDATEDET